MQPILSTNKSYIKFILECNTQNGEAMASTLIPSHHLLVVITRCKTCSGTDTTLKLATYTEMSNTPLVIDLAAVGAVIGQFHIGGTHSRWGIVDQSGDLTHAVFTDQMEELRHL